MQKEQKEKLEHERKEHEKMMKQEREDMILKYDTRIHEMNVDTERKILAVKEGLNSRRTQHSEDMDKIEREHQEKMREKEKEIARLKAEKEEFDLDFERKYGEQQRNLSERASEMDSQQHQAWDDWDRKMKERSSALEAKLAESQAKFEKKLEKQRKIMEKEAEEAFTSRVTTEIEVEKADGSRMKLSETTSGYVSQLATNLGLISGPEDQSLLEDES